MRVPGPCIIESRTQNGDVLLDYGMLDRRSLEIPDIILDLILAQSFKHSSYSIMPKN